MPAPSVPPQPPGRASRRVLTLLICLLSTALLPLGAGRETVAAGVEHLVISELVTGGTSASDELIEVYNPSSVALPLEGLELVYVTASGATITRRAAWGVGAQQMAPGSHVLVANELGIYASIADALYASGMAATGGSVALRIQGASSAVDALGWGTAASTWLEGTPAAAPAAGASLERRPGGTSGSTVDTDDNAVDFVIRPVPDPQNAGSPPVPDPTPPTPTPSAEPTATPNPTSTPTPAPTSTPAPTPSADPTATPSPTPSVEPTATPTATSMPSPGPLPTPVSIAAARALADGSTATIEGSALTAADFADGGGYVVDSTGGIAVLVDGGGFARGERLLITGTIDDRFAQRTLRADAGALVVTGSGQDPAPVLRPTGALDESVEATLVRIEGAIDGPPTLLSGGLAFDVDDGSGAARVVVGTATQIDTSGWNDGRVVAIVGVVGQRDSSGSGTSGYRLQPRDATDVELRPDASPSPTPSPSGTASPSLAPSGSPSPSPDRDVISIAQARSAAKNASVVIRGVVTLASGTIDPGSAVVQDASGAILLRLGDEAGELALGQLIEVDGVRSTKAGMQSVRVTLAPRQLGSGTDPEPRAVRTGDAIEDLEAQLVVVRGPLTSTPRRSSSGTVSFDLDDGSGPLRVVLGSMLAADDEELVAGSWVEVTGVLGQETTGALPLRGYRVWPRAAEEVRVLAGATDVSGTASERRASRSAVRKTGSSAASSLEAVGAGGRADVRVGATLVVGAWPELGLAGLLWDGRRLVGIASSSSERLERVVGGLRPPVALELAGLEQLRRDARLGIAIVALGRGAGDTVLTTAPPSPPWTVVPGPDTGAAWVSLVGRLSEASERRSIETNGSSVAVEIACDRAPTVDDGIVTALGVALTGPTRLVLPCDGVRRAPTLALVGLAAAAQHKPGPSTATAADASSGVPVDGRRAVAAGLLAAGVALVAAAALVRRRLEPADGGEGVGDADDAEADETPVGPQLTLVRVPRERGP